MRTKKEIMTEFKKAEIDCCDASFGPGHKAIQERQDLIMEMLLVLSKEIDNVNRTVINWAP